MKRFFKDDSGVAFLIFAIAVPILFIVIALAIELSGQQSVYLDNQAALESSAMSTAEFISKARNENKQLTADDIKNYALKVAQANAELDQSSSRIIPEKFSAVLKDEKVFVKSCMSVSASGIAGSVGIKGTQIVCSEGYAAIVCISQKTQSKQSCPAGQSGEITFQTTTQCPSGAPITVPLSNTCNGDCNPTTTEKTISCPSGLKGAGITMTTSISCPDKVETTIQTSYSCDKSCDQKNEEKLEQCSIALNNQKAVGTVTSMRTSVCPSGNWGEWIQTKYSCCVPQTETRTQDCPAGKIGSIKQQREKDCPANEFGEWKTVENTCENVPDGYKVYQYNHARDGSQNNPSNGVPSGNCPWESGREVEYSDQFLNYNVSLQKDANRYSCATGWYNQHNHTIRAYQYQSEVYVKYKYVYDREVMVNGGNRPSPKCSCDTGQFQFNGYNCSNKWFSNQDEGAECSQLRSGGRNNYFYGVFKRNTK